MSWRPRLRNDRKARELWDAGLAWFRLRYEEAAGPRAAMELLSRRQTAGRVALVFRPGIEVSRLYIGLPERYTAALQRLARDFAFSVRSGGSDVAPRAMPLAPTASLPWERAFVAHVVDNRAFVDTPEASGRYLPRPGPESTGSWQLPGSPPAGLALRPSWNGHLASPVCFATGETASGGWPLGHGPDSVLLAVPGPVNVYGRQEAVAAWLVQLVSSLLAAEPAGLVVIDGAGDLAPVLKRKALVTRQLGRQLTYLDIDGAAVAGGFNPLAPLPAEPEAGTLRRWRNWFAAMDVHPAGLALLAGAQQAGVADLPALERWLEQPAQQHQAAAARSLQRALQRLLSEAHIREWLSWPGEPFAGLPAGALLFSCAGGGWPRRQVLQAALLAARQISGARLVLHGLPWKEISGIEPIARGRLILTNGPPLPSAAVVLAASAPRGAERLAERFFGGNAWWQEVLELLGPGEAVVVDRGEAGFVQWQRPATGMRPPAATMAASERDDRAGEGSDLLENRPAGP